MVAVAIMAILIGVAAPSVRDFIRNTRLTGQANDLLTDLMLARSEAVKRDVSVTICGKKSSTDTVCGTDPDWKGGWFVVLDADRDGKQDSGTAQLKVEDGLTGSYTLQNTPASTTANRGAITYTPTGMAATGAATLTLCDTARANYGRIVDISMQGRASVTKVEPRLPNAAVCP
jgi:type IV fimbrial biogenesis protein FimT